MALKAGGVFSLVFGVITLPLGAIAMAQGTQTAAPPGDPVCDDGAAVIEFKPKSARLTADAKINLEQVANSAKAKPNASIQWRSSKGAGSEKAQARLEFRRASAIKTYLSDKGIDPNAVMSVGDGNKPPVAVAEAIELVACAPAPVAEAPLPQPPAPPPAATAVAAPTPPEPSPGVATTPPVTQQTTVVEPLPQAMTMPTTPIDQPFERKPASRIGIGAMVGGGVIGFVDKQVRDFADPGGSWEARMSLGTRTPFALEAAYVGSAQNINALGLGSDARLVSNGAEAAARVNLTRMAVQPYLFGGVGWQHFSVTNTPSNTSSIRDSDDVLSVPFGAGISFRLAQGLLLDLRGIGRATFNDELMEGPYANTDQDARLHTWNAEARLGWEF